MTEEMILNNSVDPNIEVIRDTMEEFLATSDVQAVYGEPIQHGDTIIIPTAEILSGFGFGLGSGGGSGTDEKTGKPMGGSGSGGGGGGRVLSRPVAVVVASPEGVRIEPVVDVTKIALAGLTALGFMVGMIFRMSGRRHGLH